MASWRPADALPTPALPLVPTATPSFARLSCRARLDFDCYQFEEDESRVHFQMRNERWQTKQTNTVRLLSRCLVYLPMTCH